jgi:hypothetical protein
MYSVRPTGAATASVVITMPISGAAPTLPRLDVIERTSLKPAWVDDVQQSIRSSVARSSAHIPGEGRWLTQDVANAANDFLSITGDILPSAPYIYSSRKGDFVAEFRATNGKLTSIVSPEFVLLFAVVNGGAPVERKLTDAGTVREEVRRMVDLLAPGAHGEVAARK